jgi:two-component system, OmpR family, response regulator
LDLPREPSQHNAMKLLLAEDDPMIGASVEQGLRLAGFTVDWARDGLAAETALRTGHYALLLLDLGLPRQDGLSLLKKLRQRNDLVPVLIVTARDAVSDRVAGLNLGADDYLIKPFDLEELVARVRALIRRHAGRAKPEMRLGDLVLDPVGHEVTLGGAGLSLSPREFALLEALMESPGAVLSKEELEERLYGWEEEVASNAIEVHVHNLRRKLGSGWVRNVRGVGYKIALPP